MTERFVGTGQLIRLIVRRDRVRLALWVGGLVALMAFSAFQVHGLYRTPAAIDSYTATMSGNPALVIFAGPGYGFERPNLGVVLVNETSLWMALGCALMSVFLVNRHTRAEEDSERADLLRSAVVGRHATITAALLVVAGANLAVSAATAVLTVIAGYPVAGSVALTASFGAVGLVFAAVAAVTAQVAGDSRAALGSGAALTGLAFVTRGIGDISHGALAALTWTSPFGWAIGVRAYAAERWWTLPALLAMAAGLTLGAYALSVHRDLGSGLVAPRLGPAAGRPWSSRPLGLAVRLQRGALIGWMVGLFLTALVYGSVGDQVEKMLADNPQLADYMAQLQGGTMTEMYLSTALRLLAMLVSGFALASLLRMRTEETAGYAESMLATPLSRWWWAISHLLVTLAGSAMLMMIAGLGVGLGYAAAIGDLSVVPRLLLGAVALIPAVVALVGAATMLFGWRPRWCAAGWAMLSLVVVVGLFGDVLRLPGWVRDLSPLQHVPALPAQPWHSLPVLALSAAAAAMLAGGLIGFRRRDLVGA